MFKELANKNDSSQLSPLTLAYIGDAVYELYVRTIIVNKGNMPVNKLHRAATQLVKAKAQSEAIERIIGFLTEGELAIYKRGRNAKSGTSPKNADVIEYRRATGFEALIGYLYLNGDNERLSEILKLVAG